MKIVQINATCGSGSTGKICVEVSKLLTKNGVENYILYSSGDSDYPLGIKCSTRGYIRRQALKARILGNWGFTSDRSAKQMIAHMERIQPDIVHLHNIHGHDCNLRILFDYFRKKQIRLYWTFHDCWAFTGYCMHFTSAQCEKWKTGCRHCPQKRKFSWSLDKSSTLYAEKQHLLQGLDLTVITPSHWMKDLVRQSFLKDNPVTVIHNGIDLSVFKPTPSDFRTQYDLEKRHIVLGVSFGWRTAKGLDVLIALSSRLGKNYQVVLVGTDEKTDRHLPSGILSIHRTKDQTELAKLYTAADIFVNPTREDTYPTVNMEAIACGTPVLTFQTGGSPEMIDETCGRIVTDGNMEALINEIKTICEEKPFQEQACLNRAKLFDSELCFRNYVTLYEVGE